MKETILVIKEVFRKFNQQYNNQELEDLVYDSIIVHTWIQENPYWRRNRKGFLDLNFEKIEIIVDGHIFQYLEKTLSKEILKMDILIPTIYENVIRNQQKEKFSIYYTPQWLVKYVVDNSLGDEIKGMKSVENLKFLEPACGAGMFLIYAFDILYDWYTNHTCLSKEEIVKRIIQENLFGIDIDERALKLCEYTLYIKVMKITNKNISLQFNLYNVDFLMDGTIDNTNFDFIIGNPPYFENRRINKYFNKEDLKSRYTSAVGRFDIYSLFIEKSLQLIKSSGIIAFVLPGNLLTNNNFSPIRQLILKKTDIMEIINLGDGIFQGVNMNMCIIILKSSKDERIENLIRCRNLSGDSNIQNTIQKPEYRQIPQTYFNNMIKNTFDINSSEVTFKLREKVFKKGYTKVNDVCEVIAGVATGNIRNKLLTRNGNQPNAKKVLEGKNIDSYYHKWSNLYLIDDKSIIEKDKGEYATFMRKEFIEEEKILIRQTANKLICTYDDNGFYLLNTLYSLKVRSNNRSKVNLKYVLGLLNSKLYSFLYRSIVGESEKLFPQVKIFHIQNSPIIIAENEFQNRIAKMVEEIMDIKNLTGQNGALISNKSSKLEIKLNKIIREVDHLIYDLFKLTCEEISEIERESIC